MTPTPQKIKLTTINTDRKLYVFLRYLIPIVPIALVALCGYFLGIYVIPKIPYFKDNLSYLYGSIFAVFILISSIFIIIFTIKRYKKNTTTMIVLNSILYVVVCIGWLPITYAASWIINNFFKYKLNVEDYWMIYIVPCVNLIVTTIVYALISIKDKHIKLKKVNLSIGAGGIASVILTGTLLTVYLVQGGSFASPGGLFRFFAILASLTTMGLQFPTAFHADRYDNTPKLVGLDIVFLSALIPGAISSTMAVVVLIVLLLIMLLGAGGGAGGGGGSSGSSSGSNRGYYDKKDSSGKTYHTNSDGSVTGVDGSHWIPLGGGTYVRDN